MADSELVCLLDLGSNAARFVLARIDSAPSVEILEEERIQTRLGDSSGDLLPRDAVEATVRAAHRFVERVCKKRRHRIVAVATAAVREATNRDVLVSSLKSGNGVDLEILSGKDEARLGAEAAVRSRSLRNGVVVDLGGGSVQVTEVRDESIGDGASVPLGTVRLTRRFFRHDPPTPAELGQIRDAIRLAAAPIVPAARAGDRFVVLGGTARALARVHDRDDSRKAGTNGTTELSRGALGALRARLEGLTSEQRKKLPGLKAERADIIVAGAIVLDELMDLGGYTVLAVSAASVREGVLFREAARLFR